MKKQLSVKGNIEVSQHYNRLVETITNKVAVAKMSVVRNLNETLLQTYWSIGQYIVEFEQNGNEKAEYGKHLLTQLSKDLTLRLGKGYSKSNLFNMRLFYFAFSKIPDSVWKIKLVTYNRIVRY